MNNKKIQQLVDDFPKKESTFDQIDLYGKSVYDAAIASVANTQLLQNLYYRSIGESVDGVADVTIKKPTVEEALSLSNAIAAEGVSLNNAKELAVEAKKQMQEHMDLVKKTKNPILKAKLALQTKNITPMMDFSSETFPVITEQTTAQGQAIKDIVNTLKTANNL